MSQLLKDRIREKGGFSLVELIIVIDIIAIIAMIVLAVLKKVPWFVPIVVGIGIPVVIIVIAMLIDHISDR